jgi:hypothetical protein
MKPNAVKQRSFLQRLVQVTICPHRFVGYLIAQIVVVNIHHAACFLIKTGHS